MQSIHEKGMLQILKYEQVPPYEALAFVNEDFSYDLQRLTVNCVSVKFLRLAEQTANKENEAQTAKKPRPPR